MPVLELRVAKVIEVLQEEHLYLSQEIAVRRAARPGTRPVDNLDQIEHPVPFHQGFYPVQFYRYPARFPTSLSPYLIVDNAKKLVGLLKTIFEATELRRFDHDNGTIAHIELELDDSILMISNSTENYPANTTMLHLYVPDVFKTFDLAVKNSCEIIEKPVNKEGDPDTRGSFYDFAGNYWAVSTQTN